MFGIRFAWFSAVNAGIDSQFSEIIQQRALADTVKIYEDGFGCAIEQDIFFMNVAMDNSGG